MLGICFECEKECDIHNHHVVPKVVGGTKTVPLCEECHGKVHNKNFLRHSELTKIGLKKMKDSGFKKNTSNHGLTKENIKLGNIARKKKALENENNIKATPYIVSLRKSGMTFQAIANKLNSEGFRTSRGGFFRPGSVVMLLNRSGEIIVLENKKLSKIRIKKEMIDKTVNYILLLRKSGATLQVIANKLKEEDFNRFSVSKISKICKNLSENKK